MVSLCTTAPLLWWWKELVVVVQWWQQEEHCSPAELEIWSTSKPRSTLKAILKSTLHRNEYHIGLCLNLVGMWRVNASLPLQTKLRLVYLAFQKRQQRIFATRWKRTTVSLCSGGDGVKGVSHGEFHRRELCGPEGICDGPEGISALAYITSAGFAI